MNDFDSFFESQKRSLVGQAFVLTGNIEEAHDIVQEVFLRVWARWSRVATLDNPPAWHEACCGTWRSGGGGGCKGVRRAHSSSRTWSRRRLMSATSMWLERCTCCRSSSGPH